MRPTTFPSNARGARIPRGSISVMTFHDRCAPARDDHGTSSRAKERAGPARAKKLRRESRHGLVCRVSKHAGPLTRPLLGGAEGLPETLRAPLEAVGAGSAGNFQSKSVSCAIVPVFTGRARFFSSKNASAFSPRRLGDRTHRLQKLIARRRDRTGRALFTTRSRPAF